MRIERLVIALAVTALAAGAAPGQPTPKQQQEAPQVALQKPPMPMPLSDLVVSAIDFQVVEHTTWGGQGAPCQIYNLFATVKNAGKGGAPAFTVLIERNKNPWTVACPTCTISTGGLAPGESRKLDARQFNNCGSADSWNEFRVTVDSAKAITESNETNNSMTRTYHSLQPLHTKIPLPK